MQRAAYRRLGSAIVAGILCLHGTVHAGDWTIYEHCRLITNPSNDGDSFHVRVGRNHYIFRLYFVDAPETDTSFPMWCSLATA